ncbi:MAG: hypothetical protein GX572_01415 [Clostridia bacterium]|nr:hypothetical protein [Clostridia bacterium]
MTIVDARGLSCPQPVLMTQQALQLNPDGCRVLVDNPAAQANITRFANKAGYAVETSEEDGDYILMIKK